MNKEELAKLVLSKVPRTPPAYPRMRHSKDGDCVEIYTSPDDAYAERIDEFVTVYLTHENDAVVGACIKQVNRLVKSILKVIPAFSVEVKDGDLHLGVLFTGKILSEATKPPSESQRIVYERLRALREEIQPHRNLRVRLDAVPVDS